MKKNLFFAALLAAGFMFSEAKAQTISVGPRLGVNFSNISTEEDLDTKMTTGIHGGVAVNIGLNDMFSIQPEILYTQKGYEVETTGEFLGYPVKMEQDATLNYLQIPVLARLSFGDDTKFFVNAGPSFGFGMGGKAKTTTTFMGKESNEDTDIESGDMEMDLGLMVGAGVGIKAGPGMLTLEGRYDHGFSAIFKDVPNETKNRTIGVSVSYMFPIGG